MDNLFQFLRQALPESFLVAMQKEVIPGEKVMFKDSFCLSTPGKHSVCTHCLVLEPTKGGYGAA